MTSVGAIILAAGSSSRMGTPKQVLPFRGTSLLRRAALAAVGAGCHPVVVVTGANAELSTRELEGLDVRAVWNRDWETGLASSIRTGIGGLLDADLQVSAALIMVCDQVHVTAQVIARLVAAHRATGKAVVASTYGGSFGVPALFDRSVFGELASVRGEGGAKRVIAGHASEAHFVPFDGGETDVDTPEDFARLTATAVQVADGHSPDPRFEHLAQRRQSSTHSA